MAHICVCFHTHSRVIACPRSHFTCIVLRHSPMETTIIITIQVIPKRRNIEDIWKSRVFWARLYFTIFGFHALADVHYGRAARAEIAALRGVRGEGTSPLRITRSVARARLGSGSGTADSSATGLHKALREGPIQRSCPDTSPPHAWRCDGPWTGRG